MIVGVDCASADTLTTFGIGNWSAGAYSANGSTAFDHCAGQASYKNGIVVVFEVGSKFQWSIGFQNPTWQLTAGQSYPVAFTIDNDAPSLGTAVAITTNQVQVQLAANTPLFERFMRGELLRVDAASQNFAFDLTNTAELLPALLQCAERYTGSSGPANPFAAPGQK